MQIQVIVYMELYEHPFAGSTKELAVLILG